MRQYAEEGRGRFGVRGRVLSNGGSCFVLVGATLVSISLATATQPRWNPSIPSIGSKNLVPNSSFELGADGWSSLGKATAGGGDLCGLYGEIQRGNAFAGAHCLRIELRPTMTTVTHSDYSLSASKTVIQSAPLTANLGWMGVSVGRTYTLSAYMRADRHEIPADLVFRFGGEVNSGSGIDTHSKRVTLTRDWARYSFSMVAYRPDLFVAVGPNLNAMPDAVATVWIDAIQLEASQVDVAMDNLPVTTAGKPAQLDPVPTAYISREPVEIGINSEHYGNLFDVAEPVGLAVSGSNSTAAGASVEVQAQLENYFGDRWPVPSAVLTIPGNGLAATFMRLNVPGTGHYRVHLSWEVEGVEQTRTIKMAVVDTYPWDDSPFGLNHAPTTAAACRQLKKAGITWIRDWSMKWESIEPSEGTYHYIEIDQQVNRILDIGFHLLPLLPPQPSTHWASEASASNLRPVERTAFAPANDHRPKLNKFIATSVERYKDRVTHWEFLNEPLWVPWYCLPTSGGYTVDSYIGLLRGAAEAMKRADPACQVIGGLSIMAPSSLGDEFIRKGGLDYIDIYNLHPYPEENGPECLSHGWSTSLI